MLSDREKAVLLAMADHLPEDYAAPFKNIATYVENTGGGCERGNIRRVVRALARKGYTEFFRGLMGDDGYLMGSGYGVTRKGREWYRGLD
jgi:hypothetical protein